MVEIKRSEVDKMKKQIVDEETGMSRFDQFEFEHAHEDWHIIDDVTPKDPAEDQRLGQMALEMISDYPLYASTSNISYGEAIAVAKVFYGNDIEQAYKEMQAEEEWFKKMNGRI